MKQKRNIIFFFYLVCGGSLFQMQPLSCASAKDPEKPQSLYVVDIANEMIDASSQDNDECKKNIGSTPLSDYVKSIPKHISWAFSSVKNIFSGIAHRNSFLDYHLQKGTLPYVNFYNFYYKTCDKLKWALVFAPETASELLVEIFDDPFLHGIADLIGCNKEFKVLIPTLKKWLADVSDDADKKILLEQTCTALFTEIKTYLTQPLLDGNYINRFESDSVDALGKQLYSTFSPELKKAIQELADNIAQKFELKWGYVYYQFRKNVLKGNKADIKYYYERPFELIIQVFINKYTKPEKESLVAWMELLSPQAIKNILHAKPENQAELITLYKKYMVMPPLTITPTIFVLNSALTGLDILKGMVPSLSKAVLHNSGNKDITPKMAQDGVEYLITNVEHFVQKAVAQLRTWNASSLAQSQAAAALEKKKKKEAIVEKEPTIQETPIYNLMIGIKDTIIIFNQIVEIVPPEKLETLNNLTHAYTMIKDTWAEIQKLEKEKSSFINADYDVEAQLNQELIPGVPTIAQLFWKVRSGNLRNDPEIKAVFEQDEYDESTNERILSKRINGEDLTTKEEGYYNYYLRFPDFHDYVIATIDYCKKNGLTFKQLQDQISKLPYAELMEAVSDIQAGSLVTKIPHLEVCSPEVLPLMQALQVKIDAYKGAHPKDKKTINEIEKQTKEIIEDLEEEKQKIKTAPGSWTVSRQILFNKVFSNIPASAIEYNEEMNNTILDKRIRDADLTKDEEIYYTYYAQSSAFVTYMVDKITFCKKYGAADLAALPETIEKIDQFIAQIKKVEEGEFQTPLTPLDGASEELTEKITLLQATIATIVAIQKDAESIIQELEKAQQADVLYQLEEKESIASSCKDNSIEQINDVEILLKKDANLPLSPFEEIRLLIIQKNESTINLYKACKDSPEKQKEVAATRERLLIKQRGLYQSNFDLFVYLLNQNNERGNLEGLIQPNNFQLNFFEKIVIIIKVLLPELRTIAIADPEEAFKGQLKSDIIILEKRAVNSKLSIDEEIIYRLNKEYFEKLLPLTNSQAYKLLCSKEELEKIKDLPLIDKISEYTKNPANRMFSLKQKRMSRYKEIIQRFGFQSEHMPKIISMFECISIPEERRNNDTWSKIFANAVDNIFAQGAVHWKAGEYEELYKIMVTQLRLVTDIINKEQNIDVDSFPVSSFETLLDELHHKDDPSSPTKEAIKDELSSEAQERAKLDQEYIATFKEQAEKIIPANNTLLVEIPLTEQVSIGVTPHGTKKLLYDTGKIYIESKIDEQVDALKKRKIKESFFKDHRLLHLIQGIDPEVRKKLRKHLKNPGTIFKPSKYANDYALRDRRPKPKTTFLSNLRQLLYGKKPKKMPHKATSLEKLRNYFDETLTPLIDNPLQLELVKHLTGKWLFNRVVRHFEEDIVGISSGTQAYNKEQDTYVGHDKAIIVPGQASFFSSLGTLVFPRLSLFFSNIKTKAELHAKVSVPYYKKISKQYIPESIIQLAESFKSMFPEEILITLGGKNYLYSEYVLSTIIFEGINSIVEYMLYDKLSARYLALYFQKNLSTLEEILQDYQEAVSIKDPVGIKYAERRFFTFVEKSKIECNVQNVIVNNMSKFFLAYNLTSRLLFNQEGIKMIANLCNGINGSPDSWMPRLIMNGGLLAAAYGMWKWSFRPVKNMYEEFNSNN